MRVQVESAEQQIHHETLTIEINLALTYQSLIDFDIHLLNIDSGAFEATAKQIKDFIQKSWVGEPEPDHIVIAQFIIPQDDHQNFRLRNIEKSDICICDGDDISDEVQVYVTIQFNFQIPTSKRGLAENSVEAITALIRHNLLLIKTYVDTFIHESERVCDECIKPKSGVL